MNYYELAEEEIKAVNTLYSAGMYRHTVYHCCIAMELLLKTKMVQIEPTSVLIEGHDIINIFKAVQGKYPSTKDLRTIVRFCRKYFNESRYPADGTEVYTKEFAELFIQYAEDIKNYIDNECTATMDELAKRFKKN